MKIAITSKGTDLASETDSRFGRAAGFILHDTETDETEYITNEQVMNSPSGAGVQSARHVVDTGAEVLLTGHCGPKAFKALNAAGIRIFTGISGTVGDALEKFNAGELTEAKNADVDGHWI